MPGLTGAANGEGYVRGCSNSTALATRAAAQLFEMLSELRAASPVAILPDGSIAVLLKALLVHGASWTEDWRALETLLPADHNDADVRKLLMQLGGYGRLNVERVLECTAQRATMIGAGVLQPEQGHVYQIPLPTCLNASVEYRRLTITLAWMTPLNHRHRKYRSTVMWFDPPGEELQISRRAADSNAVRRGTVQHEILDGQRAVAIADSDLLRVKVNCREDAGGDIELGANYAIAITLEAAATSSLPIYEQIRDRIRPRVPIRPDGR
jgi:hypothetical protein